MKSLISILALCLMLSGCAAQMELKRKDNLRSSVIALDGAQVCCKSFEEMNFIPLRKSGRNKYRIDRTSSAFDFDSGKSFFIAFEVPQYKNPYVLNVESWVDGGSLLPEMHLLYPSLLFLNKSFKPIALIKELPYVFDVWWTTSGMEANLVMGEESRTVKYLVVFMEQSKQGHIFTAHEGGGIMPLVTGSGIMYMPTGGVTHKFPFNAEGIINIEVQRD